MRDGWQGWLSAKLPVERPDSSYIILGLAVLLGELLMWPLLVPILLRHTGTAAWWQPGWLRRVLPDVRFEH